MKRQLLVFVVRWALNSLGLWVAVSLLGTGYDNYSVGDTIMQFLVAGLIFSVVNSVLKPIAVILSLPAILLTLGLFMLVLNGFMVYISLKLAPGLSITFLNSILAGLLLSLVNYIVSATLELRKLGKTQ